MEAIISLKDLVSLAALVPCKQLLRPAKLAVEYFMIQTKSMVLSSSTAQTRLALMSKAQRLARTKFNSLMMHQNSLASTDCQTPQTS